MSVRVDHVLRALLVAMLVLAGTATTAAALPPPADASGTFTDAVPIEVPAFRGITPMLSLTYESSAGNGWTGVGWSLNGVNVIERAGSGRGAPRYDATDIHLLDGEEVVACSAGSVSPSCTTGGTHTTGTSMVR